MTIKQLINKLTLHNRTQAYNNYIYTTDELNLYYIEDFVVVNKRCFIFYAYETDTPYTCRSLVAKLKKYKWQENWSVMFVESGTSNFYCNCDVSVNYEIILKMKIC